MIRPWVVRRAVFGIPHPALLVSVAVLVLGYVPETGLDHLHLHVEDGHEYVHDHPHVGSTSTPITTITAPVRPSTPTTITTATPTADPMS